MARERLMLNEDLVAVQEHTIGVNRETEDLVARDLVSRITDLTGCRQETLTDQNTTSREVEI